MLHCGDSIAASGYVGHPVAGLKWRQARKPEVRGPSLREEILSCSWVLSRAVVGGAGEL